MNAIDQSSVELVRLAIERLERMEIEEGVMVRVGTLMTRTENVVLGPHDRLDLAGRLMEEHRLSLAPVVGPNGIEGILTQEDLSEISRTSFESASEILVGEVAVPVDAGASASDPAASAGFRLLRQRTPALPVTESGEIVGTLSYADFLRFLAWS